MSNAKDTPTRDYFPFFRSFEDAISDLDDANQLVLYRAITRYGLYGKEPALTGLAATMWKLIYPNLRNSRKQYENGAKGGAPKGNGNARKRKRPTLEEAKAYFEECGYNGDAEKFFNYNESIGWKGLKKGTFKTWKEAADSWESNVDEYGE